MSSEDPPILRPMPRRPFSLATSPTLSASSRPHSPSTEATANNLSAPDDQNSAPPSRTRSILNLTSSTLFGIYSPTGYNADRDGTATPWGTGAETPIDGSGKTPMLPQETNLNIDESQWTDKTRKRRRSVLDESAKKSRGRSRNLKAKQKRGFKNYWVPFVLKSFSLAAVGVCYGVLISHLHDRQSIAPVPVDGIPHHSWAYLAFWGIAAVVLGRVMPYVDSLWEAQDDENENDNEDAPSYTGSESAGRKTVENRNKNKRGWWAPEWNDIVRSIGAFVGIAFAIRKLPWQSTLQLSLTLGLANPAIWYLLDRTPPGFILSTTIALSGTALALAINPDLIPSPADAVRSRPPGSTHNDTLFRMQLPREGEHLVGGLMTQESVGVATWIA